MGFAPGIARRMKGSESKVWDAAAASYDSERQTDQVYAACTHRVVTDLRPSGRVLDAGCGTGLATRLLDQASEVFAVDYSSESLRVLQRSVQNIQSLNVGVADLRSLPFPSGHFDCVLCANALQHLDEKGRIEAAGEILRVLRPGGRYAVSVHHFSRDKRLAGWIKEGKPGQASVDYIFRFTVSDLRGLFPGANVRAVGFYGWPMQYIVSTVFGGILARMERGHMLIAYGAKR